MTIILMGWLFIMHFYFLKLHDKYLFNRERLLINFIINHYKQTIRYVYIGEN